MSRIIKPGESGFYINRKRWHETESEVRIGVAGFFSGKAIKPGVGVMREFGQVVPSPNLLTNLGMDALGSGTNFSRMHLGTGTATPDFTDTALTNFGVSITGPYSQAGVSGEAPYYGWMRLTWTSAVGGATGSWTEIGISDQITTGNLRSHALILDSGGNPVAFPVLADEQFQGTYEFRVYAPTADSPESIQLSGIPYDTITRALNVNLVSGNGRWTPSLTATRGLFGTPSSASAGSNVWSGGLVAVTSANPGGTNLGLRTTTGTSGYTNGNYYIDSFSRWGADAGVGDIMTVRHVLDTGSFQIQYNPTITKLTTEEFIHNQRVHWARR